MAELVVSSNPPSFGTPAPGLHALTESTPDNVISDQPHLVTSRPTEFLLCLPQTNRVVEMSLGSHCSGVQAEGF